MSRRNENRAASRTPRRLPIPEWALAAALGLAISIPVPRSLAQVERTSGATSGVATTDDLTFAPGASIPLPAPDTDGGLPLLTALARRHSTREFRADPLPLPLLSNLLWAANGVNRRDSNRRTAATAHNWQNLDVYVVTAQGVFLFDAAAHALLPIRPGDLRALTGRQSFAADVPVDLVYVSDRAKVPEPATEEEMGLFDGAHAGLVAQNVYLFAASAGLGTVLRASVDRVALGAAIGLEDRQRIVLAQSVGFPKASP